MRYKFILFSPWLLKSPGIGAWVFGFRVEGREFIRFRIYGSEDPMEWQSRFGPLF